jgi:hypothetical protein
MTEVRIYQPAKTTMQSGRGKAKKWLLECAIETPRTPEPLMGWVASGDTNNQIKMSFDSSEEAVAFAEKKGWVYSVAQPQARNLKGRTYLDNFKYVPPASVKK